jgi:glycosyltransferase involved in cell wall biosynthesis
VLHGIQADLKIALISNYQPDRSHSMLGYAAMLAEGLRGRGYEAQIVYPPAILGRLLHWHDKTAKWIGYVDKYLIAPLYLRWKVRGADVVHVCDHSNSMYLRCAGRKPQIITCHDLIAINRARGRYPGVSIRWSGQIQQRWIERGLRRARQVICVSHKTETDFRELFSTEARVRVIHNGLKRATKPTSADDVRAARAALGIPPETGYLLHVGGNGWYKNRLAVIQIFAVLRKYREFQRMSLVMVGQPLTEEMHALCRSTQIEDRLIEATTVSDETLNALYTGAEALLFPSREEGFGWPLLEAQACRCPVITTNRGPMTEVAGEAAILIDPFQPELAGQIIHEQWHRRALLRDLGIKNMERFSQGKMLDAYCAAYEEIALPARR